MLRGNDAEGKGKRRTTVAGRALPAEGKFPPREKGGPPSPFPSLAGTFFVSENTERNVPGLVASAQRASEAHSSNVYHLELEM